tara:strand:- start:1509 stop:1910 length:402 start_codon:yes stop_codon:yes gene_type:complete
MKNVIFASIIGFVLGSTSTLLVLNGLPDQIKSAIPVSSDISSIIKNSTWENENGSLRIYFTNSDVCIFDLEDNPVDSKFSYSISDNKVFLSPEDIGSTFLSIGAVKLTWTFEYKNGYLITDIEENQLKLKKVN